MGGLPGRAGARLHDLRRLPDVQRHLLGADLPHGLPVGRLPLPAVLAAHRLEGHADLAEPGAADPVDPDRLPGHLLLLPQGVLPLLLRGPAGVRGRRAEDPPPLRARERPAVRPPEPASVPAVPGVHPADLPVAGHHPRVHRAGRRGRCHGGGSAHRPRRPAVPGQRDPADRLLAVVPLAAAPRRRPDRLLLVHAGAAGPIHALAAPDRPQPEPHVVGVGESDHGHPGRRLRPAARPRGDQRPRHPLQLLGAGGRWSWLRTRSTRSRRIPSTSS